MPLIIGNMKVCRFSRFVMWGRLESVSIDLFILDF